MIEKFYADFFFAESSSRMWFLPEEVTYSFMGVWSLRMKPIQCLYFEEIIRCARLQTSFSLELAQDNVWNLKKTAIIIGLVIHEWELGSYGKAKSFTAVKTTPETVIFGVFWQEQSAIECPAADNGSLLGRPWKDWYNTQSAPAGCSIKQKPIIIADSAEQLDKRGRILIKNYVCRTKMMNFVSNLKVGAK